MGDVKETGSNKLISNQGQLFRRTQSNGWWITLGTYIWKKKERSYSDKVLRMWTENSVKHRKYSSAKHYGGKRDLSLNVFLQVLSSIYIFFTE